MPIGSLIDSYVWEDVRIFNTFVLLCLHFSAPYIAAATYNSEKCNVNSSKPTQPGEEQPSSKVWNTTQIALMASGASLVLLVVALWTFFLVRSRRNSSPKRTQKTEQDYQEVYSPRPDRFERQFSPSGVTVEDLDENRLHEIPLSDLRSHIMDYSVVVHGPKRPLPRLPELAFLEEDGLPNDHEQGSEIIYQEIGTPDVSPEEKVDSDENFSTTENTNAT